MDEHPPRTRSGSDHPLRGSGDVAPAEDLMDATATARFLGVTKDLTYAMARRGDIPSVRFGRYVRFSRKALLAWIAAGGTPRHGSGG